jgi:hypothetical protein
MKRDKNIKITPTIIKDNLIFFVNSIIINPAFSSQTKDTLTTKTEKFGSKYEPTQVFLKKVAKCGIVEQIIQLINKSIHLLTIPLFLQIKFSNLIFLIANISFSSLYSQLCHF